MVLVIPCNSFSEERFLIVIFELTNVHQKFIQYNRDTKKK